MSKESGALAGCCLLPAGHCKAMSQEALASWVRMGRELGLGRRGRTKSLVVQRVEIFSHRTRCIIGVTPTELSAIQEVVGEGVQGHLRGETVALGRGPWLGASFSGLGLRIGTAPAKPLHTQEKLRDGITQALQQITQPCEMVTGDRQAPARIIADQLDIGFTVDARPHDKLQRLETLKDAGHHVLMVGDGLNDTAALAASYASVAPSTALDASRNAADVVILKESFADLPLMLRVARMTRHLSQQNFAIAALYNCVAVPIALLGFATPLAAALAMSASAITVLLNAQRMRFVK